MDAGVAQAQENEHVEENKEKAHQEKVIRAPQTSQITQILVNHNISLTQKTGTVPGRKTEDAKVDQTKKMKIRKQTTALFLQNNELRSLEGLSKVLVDVMWDSTNLLWLDLSYNYLEHIDEELLQFPTLKTLYLHGNYISNLDETKKLVSLENLQSLTLFGNPIEQIKGYRMWVLSVMY